MAPGGAAAAALRRRRLRRHGLGERPARRAPRGRLHAVLRRHHRVPDAASGPQTIVVRADDDPHDLAKPRGKQDWQLQPHSIWYPRTTGIWQTVWLERVPATWIGSVRWTPNVERWEIGFEARLDGERREGLRLNVKLCAGDQLLADDTYAVVAGEVHRRIALSDPGIDDYRNELLWSPATPTLIHAELKLWGGRGELVDTAAQLHRAALHRRAGRPLRPQRPALPAAHGARPGLLARKRPDRAGRRGAAARRGAGQGHGLQRRAQAPEDRGPALPLLGRRARPAGLGGDAQRLPLHQDVDRAADARVDRGRSSATSATPASSPGCRSTNPGACPTCPTARRSATTCRRSTT